MQNTTILNYKLIEKIGEGGFAEVWLAEHTKLGTKSAIKILDKKILEIEGIKDRFLRAAKLLSSIKHPNIVEVIDFDDSDKYVMVMEYLDGPMFREYIKQNYDSDHPLKLIPLFIQLLNAVDYIHHKGVIHRDIKPTNVIIINQNQATPKVKLLDFDIAKDLNSEHTATLTNQQMGTITYMSPEQVISAKNIDSRSDIYSLGVMFFYVVAGQPAYSSQIDSQFQLMEKIVREPLPSLKKINSKIPDWAIAILKKATQKDPALRFQSCQEFSDELTHQLNKQESNHQNPDTERTLIVEKPKPVPKPNSQPEEQPILFADETPKKSSKTAFVTAALVIIIAIIGVGVYTYSKPKEEALLPINENIPSNTPENKKGFENTQASAYFKEGKIQDSLKNYQKAKELYEKALTSGNDSAYNNLGVLLAFKIQRKGYQEKGEEYLKKGVELGDVKAMSNLGLLYFSQHRINESKQMLKEALVKNRSEAAKMIQKIRKIDPSFSIVEDKIVKDKYEESNSDEVFTTVDQNPEFPGGIKEMYAYVGRNLKYPKALQRANVSGKVLVKFIVEKDGRIGDVEILKGIGFGFDEEVERVIKSMPKWNPGKQHGQIVRVFFTMPINIMPE